MTTATAAPWIDLARGWSELAEGAARLQRLCSNEVGIVRRTYRQLYDVDDLPVEAVGSDPGESTARIGAPCTQLHGGGPETLERAPPAAIGEAVERYSAAYVDPGSLVVATPAELNASQVRHVRPGALRLFADEQLRASDFRYAPFTDDTTITWVEGRSLADGDTCLLPANLVFLAPIPWGAAIGYPTSNGVACHLTPSEALAGGILELCERDAFTRVWYRRLTMPLLEIDDAGLRDWIDTFVGPTGLSVSLVDLTPLTTCPAVLAVIRNHATRIAPLALGAACAATAVEAARKAIIEGFQTRIWAKAEQRDDAVLAPTDDFGDVLDFDDHVRLSLHPDAISAASFLDASKRRTPISSIPPLDARGPGYLITDVVRRLEQQGVDLYGVELSSPDVRDAGLSVMRAFSPQLQPLDAGFAQRYIGGRRLHDLTTTGYSASETPPSPTLNPWPHPFP